MKTRLLATLAITASAFNFTPLIASADEGRPLEKRLVFNAIIAPDSSALLGLFSRFTPETCERGSTPSFDELIIQRDAENGTIIDDGIVMARNLNCEVPARILIYRADADFDGTDQVVIKDPQTESIVDVTYGLSSEYNDLPKEWDTINASDAGSDKRQLTTDTFDILGHFPTTPPENCSSEYPDLYAPTFDELSIDTNVLGSKVYDGGLAYKIFTDKCDILVRVVIYKTGTDVFEEDKVTITDNKNSQTLTKTYSYTDTVRMIGSEQDDTR